MIKYFHHLTCLLTCFEVFVNAQNEFYSQLYKSQRHTKEAVGVL